MDRLPDEVILNILTWESIRVSSLSIALLIVLDLEVSDVVHFQSTSRRFLKLCRDTALWKTICFDHSLAEERRRRQALFAAQDPRLAELRNAVTALPGNDLSAYDVSQIRSPNSIRASADPAMELSRQRARALVNWEPGYPGEKLNYFQEYIHRHAAINVGWLDIPSGNTHLEATGVGFMNPGQDGSSAQIVAPIEDGSICIWDASQSSTTDYRAKGRLLGRSSPGVLTGLSEEQNKSKLRADSKTIMTESGAVECVSINSWTKRGYFAVQNTLREVDLATLQLVSSERYPFAITALSEASPGLPITVGTNWTIHMYDPRNKISVPVTDGSTRCELIGGGSRTHAALEQPGPTSILHYEGPGTDGSSIWVAGRFTPLLNYDRRFFPRLCEVLHSGARIACLSLIPHPFKPRTLDLMRNSEASTNALHAAKSGSGTTLLAAAEYKGKGSLELYGLPQAPGSMYQNRQTASASKLLSVAPHGGRIVFSDGDGNLKWVERDGYSTVRTFNIQDAAAPETANAAVDASTYGIWSSTASEMPGQGDIVQKIIPLTVSSSGVESTSRPDVDQDDLLLWTGDGRVGVLGFGHQSPYPSKELKAKAGTAVERAREDAERQYGMAMRRALERNANEVRFVRGLGMGFVRH